MSTYMVIHCATEPGTDKQELASWQLSLQTQALDVVVSKVAHSSRTLEAFCD